MTLPVIEAKDIPGFTEFVNANAHVVLEAEHFKLTAIATNAKFRVEEFNDGVRVFHVASGLGYCFYPDSGSINSKSYDTPNWQSFEGLGIGTRIYEYGASLYPNVRWSSGVVASRRGWRVREKLHGKDPYRWSPINCEWCRSKKIDWPNANHEEFNGHPIYLPPIGACTHGNP